MYAKNLVVDDHAQRQEIEHVCKVMPDIRIAVLAGAFCVEAIGLGDATRFMVSPDEMDTVGIPQFEADQKRDGFNAEETAVDIVACKVA